MDNFMTATCTHQRPTGTGSLTPIKTGVVCSPPDPISSSPSQEYPLEVLLTMREFFTKYSEFQPGDYATFNGIDYPVRAVQEWDGLGSLDTYYRVLIEARQGSS